MIAQAASSLAGSKLFHGIDQSKIGHYTGRFITNMYPARSSIFAQGDSACYLHVIVSGRVKMTRLTEDGREIAVGFFRTSELVGDEVLLGNAVFRNTTARCMEDSMLCTIRADDFRELIDASPRMAMNVARHFAEQRDAALDSIEDVAFLHVSKRLVRAIQRLAAKYGTDLDGGRLIDVRLTHAEIAALIGSTRETVSLELKKLIRSGQLGVRGRRFFLPSSRDAGASAANATTGARTQRPRAARGSREDRA